MSKQTINIGASPNDGTGTPLRTSFDYTNQNFTEIYTALGGGVALPGATTQVIFNDGGTNLAGDAGLVYNKTTDALTVAGLVTAGSATITGAATVGTTLGVTGDLTASSDVLVNGNEKYVYLYSTYNIGSNSRVRFRAVGAGGGSGYGGDLRISTRNSINNWNTDVLTVDSTGKVGIGTASPTATLDVVSGGTASTYTVSAVIRDGTYPASGYPTLELNGFIGGNGYRSGIGSIGGQQLAFYTPTTFGVAPTLRMTLDASGRLIRGGLTADTLATDAATMVNIGNFAVQNAADAGTYIAIKPDVAGQNVNINTDARTGAVPDLRFLFASAEKFRMTAGGNLNIANGNVVMTTSGKGIDFSATTPDPAGMSSETLSDYEEGLWTGTLTGGTTTPATPIAANGRYTKIGRQVSVQIAFENISNIGYLGNLTITGLPFANTALRAIGTAGTFTGATFTGTLISQVEASNTNILFYGIVSNAFWASATHNPNANSYFWANLTYTV